MPNRNEMPDFLFDACFTEWSNSTGSKPYWGTLAARYEKILLETFGNAESETLRGWFKRERKHRDGTKIKKGQESPTKYYQYKFGKSKDGTYTSDRLIEIFEGDLNDDKKLLEAHNLDPEKWTIIDSTSNMWHAQRPKDMGQLVQFQSKIRIKPKTVQDINHKDILEYYKKNEFVAASPIKVNYKKPKVKRVLEICLADWHIGARWYNKNWSDLEEIFPNMLVDILQQADGTEFSEIWLVPLGDIFHYETRQQQTERHQQVVDSNGMNPLEMFDLAKQMFVSAIDSCLKIAPVKTWYIPGNHDAISAYHLLSVVESFYRNQKHYTTDLSHTARKWQLFGENLIAWEHGDMPKKNQISWLQTDARDEWGESKYAEIHFGHLHHEEVTEHAGIKRRRLPAIAPTDYWHHRSGYNGVTRATMAFVWEENRIGFKQMWQSTGVNHE
jgi:hypothetical protein